MEGMPSVSDPLPALPAHPISSCTLPPSVRVYEFVKIYLSTQNRTEPTSNSQCIASFTAARLRSTTLAMHTPASELSDREALQFPSRDLISSEARNRAGLFLILQRHLHRLLTQWSETRVFPVSRIKVRKAAGIMRDEFWKNHNFEKQTKFWKNIKIKFKKNKVFFLEGVFSFEVFFLLGE